MNVWHRALVLQAENSLIAIDPRIDGLPYWDWRRDVAEQNSTWNLTKSVIFSADYFGEYNTQNTKYKQLTTGRFAHWRVHDNPVEVGCSPPFGQNAFGLLRGADNAESSPFVTRFGGTVCGQHGFAVGDLETYDFCLDNMTDVTDFMACYDLGVHGRPHLGIGGSRLAFEGQMSVAGDSGLDCLARHLFSGTNMVCTYI